MGAAKSAAERLAEIRRERERMGLSYADLARTCGERNDLRVWRALKGKTRKVDATLLDAMEAALNLDEPQRYREAEEFVGDGTGAAAASRRHVPVMGRVAADAETRVEWFEEAVGVVEIPAEAVGLEEQGASMAPVLRHGQVAIVTDEPARDGDLAVVVLRNGVQLLKQYFEEGGRVILRSVEDGVRPLLFKPSEIRRTRKVRLGAYEP